MPTGSGLEDRQELGLVSGEILRQIVTVPSPVEPGREHVILAEVEAPVGHSRRDGLGLAGTDNKTKESRTNFRCHTGFEPGQALQGLGLNVSSGRKDGQDRFIQAASETPVPGEVLMGLLPFFLGFDR